PNDGSRGHVDNQISAASPMAVGGAASAAVFGSPEFLMGNAGQAIGPGQTANDDRAAVAAIAAVRPATGDVLFPAEAAHAAPSMSAGNKNRHAVYEHRRPK